MREIKFRAYIKENCTDSSSGKILNVSSIHLKKNTVIIGYSVNKYHYGNRSFSYEDIELMQFTGLKDKNGKEIYEGDIVKGFIPLSEDEDDLNIQGIVIYNKYSTEYIIIENNNDELGLGYINDLEVIGNKWENPELLEEE